MTEIKTPIESTKAPVLSGKTIAVIPILRAGLGMVKGLLTLVPTAKIGHIGMYRDKRFLNIIRNCEKTAYYIYIISQIHFFCNTFLHFCVYFY